MGHASFWSMLIMYIGEIIDTIRKNREVLLDANKEVGLEVNPEKTKFMLI
jgi:hypothetical protein